MRDINEFLKSHGFSPKTDKAMAPKNACKSASKVNQKHSNNSQSDSVNSKVDLNEDDLKKKCLQTALDYLSRREHSHKELNDKLVLKQYPREILEHTFSYLLNNNFLSDLRFAEMMIRTRQMQGYGKYYITQELHAKGVDSIVWDDINASLDTEDSWSAAIDIALKKRTPDYIIHIKTNSQANDYEINSLKFKHLQKVKSFLSRRGFDHNQITRALDGVEIIISE